MPTGTGVFRRYWQPPQRHKHTSVVNTSNVTPHVTGVAAAGGVGTLTGSFPIQRPGIYGVQGFTFPSNWVANPLGTGLTPGTIGAGGVMPTNWSASTNSNGLAWEVSTGATYVVNGLSIPTVRLRLHGTTSSTLAAAFSYQTAALGGLMFGQTGCQSAYVAIAAGSTANFVANGIANWGRIQDSTSAVVVDNQPPAAFTSSFTQFSMANTMPATGNAPFNWLSTGFVFDPSGIGVAIDLTIDVGGGQLVYGSSPVTLQPTTPKVSGNITGVAATGQVATLSGGAFSRSSTATYLDAGGNLISVGNDVLRPNYSGGVATGALIEAASTNLVPNPRWEGVATGTPGTPPTNIFWWGGGSLGLTQTCVATGTENGMPFMDIQISGTPSSTTTQFLLITSINNSVQGDTWSISGYVKLAAGSTTNTDLALRVETWNAVGGGGSFVNLYQSATFLPTNAGLTSQQHTFTATITDATAASMKQLLVFDVTSGLAVNFTIRVGGFQCEKSSTVSSLILPPIGSPAVATRAADTVSTTGIPLIMEPLSGVSATGQVGTLTIPRSGSSTLIGVGGTGQVGTLTLAIQDNAVASASGSSTASATGAPQFRGVATATSTSTASATGASQDTTVGSAAGTSTASATGASQDTTVGSASGSSTASATGAPQFRGVATASGSSTATAVGADQDSVIATASGSSTASAVGASQATTVASAAGTSSASATGAAQDTTVGSADGTSDASAVGASTNSSIASAAGTSTADATGAAQFLAVATADGSSTADAVSPTGSNAVGTATGSSTASAVGLAKFLAVASAAGTSTASATGAAQFLAVATASGSSTASAVSTIGSTATASGSSTASAVGASTVASVGSAAGTSTALAHGAATAAATATAAGSATVTALAGSVATASGTSSAAADGEMAAFRSAHAAGSSTCSGVGASLAASVGHASGNSIALAIASALVAAAGTAEGTADVIALAGMIATALGSSTASAVGRFWLDAAMTDLLIARDRRALHIDGKPSLTVVRDRRSVRVDQDDRSIIIDDAQELEVT